MDGNGWDRLSGMAWGRECAPLMHVVEAVVLGTVWTGEEGWFFDDQCSVNDAIVP